MRLLPILLLTSIPLTAVGPGTSAMVVATACVRILEPIQVSKIKDFRLSLQPGTKPTQISIKEGAAEFKVRGSENLSHSLLLPDHVLLRSRKGEPLVMDRFEYQERAASISVSGTLTLAGRQAAGSYSGSCDVAVAYE